ncbi:MAG TPA: hypothetical protein VGM19_05905 [Armatimonadota bacterium]
MAKLELQNVPADRVLAFVEAVASGFSTIQAAAAYIYLKSSQDVSSVEKRHTRTAAAMARELGLAEESEDGTWHLTEPAAVDLNAWSADAKRILFRARLQKFAPFVKFCDFVRRGMSSREAAIRTCTLLDVDIGAVKEQNVLASWGEYAGIMARGGGRIALSERPNEADLEERIRILRGFESALVDEMAARTWLEQLLGKDAFDSLDEAILDDLAKALSGYAANPGDALRDAGRALEDYLKTVALSNGLSLMNASGKPIEQIAKLLELLRTNKLIAGKHVNIVKGLETFVEFDVLQGLAAFRNIPSHGRSAEENERWSLGDEIALCVVVQTVLTMRSLYYYVVKNKPTY